MKTKLYMKIISFILVLTMLFSLVACSSTPEDPSASNPPSWTNPTISDPNGGILGDDILTDDILVEAMLYEEYIEELVEVENSVTELLLAEETISDVLYQKVLYVPQEHLSDFAKNSHTAQLFGDDIDVESVITKVSIGAGIIVALTVCSTIKFSKPIVSVAFKAAAKGSAIGAGIGAYVGGAYGGTTGALNEIDSTGRNAAAFGLALAIVGLVVSTVSLVAAIPSGGLSGISAVQGAKLVFAGLALLGSTVDTVVNTVDCVKTFNSTNAEDIDWKNINWTNVGLSAAEQAINGASNGLIAGAVAGAIASGTMGYLDYKNPNSIYNGTKRIGTVNELSEIIDDSTGSVIGKLVKNKAGETYIKTYVDPDGVNIIGDIPDGRLAKITAQVDESGNVISNWESKFQTARNRAVKAAWAQEKKLVETNGRGTRDWTAAEIEELKTTGEVKGYQGHHINSAKFTPELADDPNNIVFYSDQEHLTLGHGGNFKNVTFGELVNRSVD